jgi:hypothetical protein
LAISQHLLIASSGSELWAELLDWEQSRLGT